MDCCQTPGRSVRQGAVNPSLTLKCMVCHWGGLGPSVCGAISTEAAERKSRPPEASLLTLLCLATRSLSPSLPVHLCMPHRWRAGAPMHYSLVQFGLVRVQALRLIERPCNGNLLEQITCPVCWWCSVSVPFIVTMARHKGLSSPKCFSRQLVQVRQPL